MVSLMLPSSFLLSTCATFACSRGDTPDGDRGSSPASADFSPQRPCDREVTREVMVWPREVTHVACEVTAHLAATVMPRAHKGEVRAAVLASLHQAPSFCCALHLA
jgi:hypothetical protein